MSGFGEIMPTYTIKTLPDGRQLLNRKFIDTSKTKKHNIEEQSCMFCKKAERPFNHFFRKNNDPEGEIICEYLLTIKCEHCNDLGHTKKYCPRNKNSEYRLSSDNSKYIYIDKSNCNSKSSCY